MSKQELISDPTFFAPNPGDGCQEKEFSFFLLWLFKVDVSYESSPLPTLTLHSQIRIEICLLFCSQLYNEKVTDQKLPFSTPRTSPPPHPPIQKRLLRMLFFSLNGRFKSRNLPPFLLLTLYNKCQSRNRSFFVFFIIFPPKMTPSNGC